MTEKGFEEEEERKGDFRLVHRGTDKREEIHFRRAPHSKPAVRLSLPAKWRRDHKNRNTCPQGSSKNLLVGRLQRGRMEEKGQTPTHVTGDHCLQVRESPAQSCGVQRRQKKSYNTARPPCTESTNRHVLHPDLAANSEGPTLQLPHRTQEAPTC